MNEITVRSKNGALVSSRRQPWEREDFAIQNNAAMHWMGGISDLTLKRIGMSVQGEDEE